MNKFLGNMAFCLFTCVLSHAANAAPAVDVEIVSRGDGRQLPVYRDHGRLWVAGNPGETYAVRLLNRTGARVLTVLSIDGVNAVSGETAAASQSGYVLSPWAGADIRGWRKSLDDIAQFTFTRLSDSYAARTGRPGNVGVIGVAVFHEAPEPPPVLRPDVSLGRARPAPESAGMANKSDAGTGSSAADSAESAAPASPAGAAPAQSAKSASSVPAEADRAFAPQRERLGTGHGAREHDPTAYTAFRRASSWAAETIVIYYDSYDNLVARGIVPREPHYSSPRPNPFPGQFVPDPQG